MPWLLEVAIILSIVLKHYLEAGIIFALLTINTVIGQYNHVVHKKPSQL